MGTVGAELDDPVGGGTTTFTPHDVSPRRKCQTARGGESTHVQGHALGLLETEARLGGWKHHHPPRESQPCIEHFAGTGPLGWVVVEEDDALTNRHGASGPREDRAISDQRVDGEEREPIEERRDLASGDGDAFTSSDDLGELTPMASDRRPFGEMPPGLEVAMDGLATGQVPLVQGSDRIERNLGFLVEHVDGRAALPDHIVGLEGLLEADAIEVLSLQQQLLALTISRAQLDIGAEDVVSARMQAQIHGAPVEVLREILVLELAFLPTRGDDGELSGNAQSGDSLRERRIDALRAQEDDGAGHSWRSNRIAAAHSGPRETAKLTTMNPAGFRLALVAMAITSGATGLLGLTACHKNSSSSPASLDAEGCFADPPPPPAGEQGPFPFESCRPELPDRNPLRVIDEEATAARRKTQSHACCYKVAQP